jgi:hypothetical protein
VSSLLLLENIFDFKCDELVVIVYGRWVGLYENSVNELNSYLGCELSLFTGKCVLKISQWDKYSSTYADDQLKFNTRCG